MDYIFDTDAIVAFYDNENQAKHLSIHNKIVSLKKGDNVYISVLTLYEYYYSYSNAQDEEKDRILMTIKNIESDFQILPVGKIGASIFGQLKTKYKTLTGMNRENIKKMNIDFIIASTAIIKSCIIVSNDKIYEKLSAIYENLNVE